MYSQMGHSYFEVYDNIKGWGDTVFFSYWNEYDRSYPNLKYAEAVVLCLLAIASFVINITFIAFFLSSPKLRSVTNICIVNVCVAGIVTVPFVIMVGVTRLHAQWEYGAFGCFTTMLSLMITASTIIWTLALISIERLMKIVLSHRPQITHKKAIALIIGVAWVFPLVSDIAMGSFSVQTRLVNATVNTAVNTTLEESWICMVQTPKQASGFRLILLVVFIIFGIHYIGPIVIISVCYGKIMAKLKKTEKMIAKHRKSVHRKGESSTATKRKRAITMLIVMLVVTIVMWLPLFLMLTAVAVDTVMMRYDVSSQGFIWIVASISLNTIINPILYTLTSTQHRRQLHLWLKCNNKLLASLTFATSRSGIQSRKMSHTSRSQEQESSLTHTGSNQGRNG